MEPLIEPLNFSSSAAVPPEDLPSILPSQAPFRHTFHSISSQANALKPGLFSNTFLFVDPTYIDSVLRPSGWVDEMRVLVLEADYLGRSTHMGMKVTRGFVCSMCRLNFMRCGACMVI